MTSHEYQFSWRDLAKPCLAPLLPVALFPLLMQALLGWHALPEPKQSFDLDRTIIAHQAEASRKEQTAEAVLMGDSSCLMGIDPLLVGDRLGVEVLNLGMLSYLSLNEHAQLLERYLMTNRGRLKTVMVFLHPVALRRSAPERYQVSILQRALEGGEYRYRMPSFDPFADPFSLDLFRSCVWIRLLPSPLPGSFGAQYGFTRDLDRYLSLHRGGLIDPTSSPFQGDREYVLAPSLEKASLRFRKAVPAGVTLVIGVTPVPEGFASGGYSKVYQDLVEGWAHWINADVALRTLPPTLPNRQFASVTHLNAAGRAQFSELVAGELAKRSVLADR
jgi:hypothetical protein